MTHSPRCLACQWLKPNLAERTILTTIACLTKYTLAVSVRSAMLTMQCSAVLQQELGNFSCTYTQHALLLCVSCYQQQLIDHFCDASRHAARNTVRSKSIVILWNHYSTLALYALGITSPTYAQNCCVHCAVMQYRGLVQHCCNFWQCPTWVLLPYTDVGFRSSA